MADEVPEHVDLWDVLEEAELTVERWPSWQRRYDADIYYDVDAPASGPPPAQRQAGGLHHTEMVH